MRTKLSAADRRRLAAVAGINEAYLYQCLTGHRDMGPVVARRCEVLTNGELMRWDLCQRTWDLIWPELKLLEGAPVIEKA